MSKVTLLVLLALFSFSFINAGTQELVLFEESFEGADFPPSNWNIINDGFILDNWTSSSAKANTGSKSAYAEAYYMALNHWLITPAVDLSSATGVYLYFNEDQAEWADNGSHHYIKVSTTSQTNTSSFTTILDMIPATHTIAGFGNGAVMVDLSAYAGESTVYIAFHIEGSDEWWIDDVTVASSQEHDVSAISVDIDNQQTAGSSVTPMGTVFNIGNNAESFDVNFGYYNWDGTQTILDTKSVSSLASGSETQVTFDNFTIGNYERQFFIQTVLSGDMDATNDIAAKWLNTFSYKKDVCLIEEGTGTWCQYCAGVADALETLRVNYPDNLALIANHNGDDYTTSETNYRNSYYGVSGFPTSIIGGDRQKVGGRNCDDQDLWDDLYTDFEQVYLEELDENTFLSLSVTFSENGSEIYATSTATYETESYQSDLRIFFTVTEDHIAESWECLDSLHFAARKMYPDSLGLAFYTDVIAPTEGMEVQHDVSFTLDGSWVKAHSNLVVFVQDLSTKEVLAAKEISLANAPSAIENPKKNIVEGFELYQNYPNPFNPVTTIPYHLNKAADVKLEVYSATGEKVYSITNNNVSAGRNHFNFDASNFSSGVYFYKINSGSLSKTNKMLLVK